MKNPVFWLFCTVIDNFGDIGVTWRLANELRVRLNARVFLWLDDVATLTQLAADWCHAEIQILTWQEGQHGDLTGLDLPDVVIETFACKLPENVLQVIAQTKAVWLNWEYLSAEDWAVRTHLMPSVQANGMAKWFWQMGFLPETGGLLRESNYAARRLAFRQPEHAACHVFVFGYQSAIWSKWARTWQNLGRDMVLHLAGDKVINSLKQDGFLPHDALIDDTEWHSGCLKWVRAEFVPQRNFDTLLWAADWCIVRGEDSFVRAQWSGKPFFWHIYPQDEAAHGDKLAAFWRLPRQIHSETAFQAAFDVLSAELNGLCELDDTTRLQHFKTLFANEKTWQKQATMWHDFLWQQSDAVSRLGDFLQNQLP